MNLLLLEQADCDPVASIWLHDNGCSDQSDSLINKGVTSQPIDHFLYMQAAPLVHGEVRRQTTRRPHGTGGFFSHRGGKSTFSYGSDRSP